MSFTHTVYQKFSTVRNRYPRCTSFFVVVGGYGVAIAIAALSAQVVR